MESFLSKVLRAARGSAARRELNGEDEVNATRAVSLFLNGVAAAWALQGLPHFSFASLPSSAEAKAWADVPSPWAAVTTALYIGYILFDMATMRFWPAADRSLFVFHHLASIAIFPVAVGFRFCHTYVLFFIATELSSGILAAYLLLEKYLGKEHVVTQAGGYIFAAVFFGWRMVGSMRLYFLFYQSPPWNTAPAETPPAVTWLSLSTTIPPLLNFYWGAQVVQSIIKQGPPSSDWTQKKRD